ncbi:hypothetical protein BD770DRAFT_441576, partial [Pilaira anomala]
MNSVVNDYYDRIISKIKEYETFSMYQDVLCGDDVFNVIIDFWYRLFLFVSSAVGLDDNTTDLLLSETSLNYSTFSSMSDNTSLFTAYSSQSNPFIDNLTTSSVNAIRNLSTSSGIDLHIEPERTGIAAYVPYETMDKIYNFLLNFLFPLKQKASCSIPPHPSNTMKKIFNFTRKVICFTDKDHGVKFDSHLKCVNTLTNKRDYNSFSFFMAVSMSTYIVLYLLYKLGRMLFGLRKNDLVTSQQPATVPVNNKVVAQNEPVLPTRPLPANNEAPIVQDEHVSLVQPVSANSEQNANRELTPAAANADENVINENSNGEDANDEDNNDESADNTGDDDVDDADNESTSDESAYTACTGTDGSDNEGADNEGVDNEGAGNEGATNEGATNEGTTNEGATNEGVTNENTDDENTDNK